MSSALIIGSRGQDGTILSDLLSARGVEVHGVSRAGLTRSGSTSTEHIDISNADDVASCVRALLPDQIYYLAAFHHSAEDVPLGDAALFQASYDAHVKGLLNILEAVRLVVPTARTFYAASSLVFGDPSGGPQDESTSFAPICPYGMTKAMGCQVVRYYRDRHSLFACNGILYNHESALRAQRFVTQKIISGAVAIKAGNLDHLSLGDLDASADWGYAPDFADAMSRILSLEEPDDFIVATGVSHTVRELVEITFNALDLDWRKYVKVDPRLVGRKRHHLVGNREKLEHATGWHPSVSFTEMIKILLAAKGLRNG